MTAPWGVRAFQAGDTALLHSFKCATSRAAWDVEVETWVQSHSAGWVGAESHADMDRRLLLLRNPRGTLVGIAAHELKDAVLPGKDGVFFVRFLTCIAVASRWQGRSIPRQGKVSDVLLATALNDIAARPEQVPFVNALIHQDNYGSSVLFARNGFVPYRPPVDGYVRHTLTNG